MSRDASVRQRGKENGGAVAQVAGAFSSKSLEIERCNRGLPLEDWHLIKSQSGTSNSNEICSPYISPILPMIHKDRVVGPATNGRPACAMEVPT